MKNLDLLNLLNLLEDDLKQFNDVDMANLEKYAEKDIKLEEGLVQFIISTLPGDLNILSIDLKQEEWLSFNSSLKKINAKLKLVGALELITLSNQLANLSNTSDKIMYSKFELFKSKINELLLTLQNLYSPN